MFVIRLHVDDFNVLGFIQNNLNIGRVVRDGDECKFLVTDKDGIDKLISIFDKYTLNSSKYLDYLDFKEAFRLYFAREGVLTDSLKDKILVLKEGMNLSRVHIEMPNNHKIVITKYWLLGLIEGEGSFQLWRNDIQPAFGLVLSIRQLALLEKIKEFLFSNLGFDIYSLFKLNSSSSITLNQQKARNNSKASVLLLIKDIHILHNYFIPFLNKMEFLTKKGKDFNDFQIICRAVYNGAHRREDIKSLIIKLSLTMNNYRLSTYPNKVELLSESERNALINAYPGIKHLNDGRQIDLASGKLIHQNTSSLYEVIKPNHEVILNKTLGETAGVVGVNIKTLSKYLDDNSEAEINGCQVKRIAVFYNK
jgi:hypothetical protein